MDERYASLAELLSYPSERTESAIGTLLNRGRDPSIEAFAASFPEFLRGVTAAQELYTIVFDVQPVCAPYFGHHLFGEDSPLRGPLLARLAEIYAANGFVPRDELGDHVAEVLRFLAVAPPSRERDDLVRDGLLPALKKMIEAFDGEANPYRDVLVLTERILRASFAALKQAGTPERERRAAP